jgi:hypothetical protein
MGEAVVFLGVVTLIAVIGVRLGMLVAPRLERLTPSDDEDDRGDHTD